MIQLEGKRVLVIGERELALPALAMDVADLVAPLETIRDS